jgi:hypothetical protein
MFNFGVALTALSVSLILISLITPWLAINFLGNWIYSPIDILKTIRQNAGNITGSEKPNLIALISPNQDRSFDLVFSSISYLISIPLIFIALVAFWMKRRSRITIVAGILAVVAGITWIHSIQLIEAGASAALGKELVDAVFVMGSSPYLVSIGGIIAISAYFVTKKYPVWSRAT